MIDLASIITTGGVILFYKVSNYYLYIGIMLNKRRCIR